VWWAVDSRPESEKCRKREELGVRSKNEKNKFMIVILSLTGNPVKEVYWNQGLCSSKSTFDRGSPIRSRMTSVSKSLIGQQSAYKEADGRRKMEH